MIPQSIVVCMLARNALRCHFLIPLTHDDCQACDFFFKFDENPEKNATFLFSVSWRCQSMTPQSIVVHIINDNAVRHHCLMPHTHRDLSPSFFLGNLMKILKKNHNLPFICEFEASKHDTSEYC